MNGVSPGKYVPSTQICTEPFSSRYTVQEDIGRGKFAVVRKCLCKESGEVVAAKIIRKRRKGKSCREEILREVVMLELAMAHPRLVSLREVFETPSELILVTEYCAGGELFQECVINESFKEDDVRKLLVQILEGLAYLHDNNIVHLDLKPQNILLTKPFPQGDVKICDLGFACLTNTGEDIRDIIGTPDYVAPEVLDYEPLNIQTDMWSLGVLTYVMLTTCSPFVGDDNNETFCNITQVKLDFPDELFGHINDLAQDFISKLLVKSPRHRLTAKECLDHPWLSDLTKSLSINVPTPDHSFELAQDMIKPSNWHMTADRQKSLVDSSSQETMADVPSEIGSLASLIPPETHSLEPLVPPTPCSPNEDKDPISKPLSHIDIDHSSSTSFETCLESLDSFRSISSLPSGSAHDLDVANGISTGQTMSSFAANMAKAAITKQEEAALSSFGSNSVISQEDATDTISNSFSKQEDGPPSNPVDNGCLNQAPLLRESNKEANALKRMSMEIPPKRAKCIEGADQLEEAEPLPNASNGQSCNNSIEDLRNAV